MGVTNNSKMAASQIKRLTTYKAMLINSDSYNSIGVPRKKKMRTGVLPSRKQEGKNTPKNYGAWRYFVLYKKARMTECKWK